MVASLATEQVSGGDASDITVRQARNGSSMPGTELNFMMDFDLHPRWVSSAGTDDAADIAALILPETAENPSQDIHFAVPKNSFLDRLKQLNGERINVAGYPRDLNTGKDGDTMWHDYGPITRYDSRKLLYSINTTGGNSGSPVYYSNIMWVR